MDAGQSLGGSDGGAIDMTAMPEVSVVMSVFNGEQDLAVSLESVLAQEGVNFELIVVNDGSIDRTGEILTSYQDRDDRITVLSQTNRGLTLALIEGCRLARGGYIARIDCGDRFLPNRLASQYEILSSSPQIGLISCGTRFIGPEGELLYEIQQTSSELEAGLRNLDINCIQGPSHHGSTMFSRALYREIGGYRPQFPLAQDLDLWLRISEAAAVSATPEILYESKFRPEAISATNRKEQIQSANLIVDSAKKRRAGLSEPAVSDFKIRSDRGGEIRKRRSASNFYYFIASCVENSQPEIAKQYFLRAWRENPLKVKSLARYIGVRGN